MINIPGLTNNNSDNPFDRYVPIIQNKHTTDAYLTGEISEPSEYNELCHLLLTASPAENFTLHINTPGGIIDSAMMILDAIKNSKAKVTARISGTVASAGTIITLACDKIIVSDHITFMVHNYSGGVHGKGHEMKARQEFLDKNLNTSFKIFYKDFLSEEEMTSVIDGKDLWMGKDEVVARIKGTWHVNKDTE